MCIKIIISRLLQFIAAVMNHRSISISISRESSEGCGDKKILCRRSFPGIFLLFPGLFSGMFYCKNSESERKNKQKCMEELN